MKSPLYVGLVHYPIYDKNFNVIATAITNYDLHDISRSAKTYGVKKYFIIHHIEAQLDMAEGPARIEAPSGSYNYRTEQIDVAGPIAFTAADGYRMTTSTVRIDLDSQAAVGSGGVAGEVPTGNFSADSIVANLRERTVRLEGNARLRMVPGKLRVPK